jgi:hypothetical protein
MQIFTCQGCGKEWSENYCPECAQSIDRSLTPQPPPQCANDPASKPLTGELSSGERPPCAMQKTKPTFGVISVAMWVLAVAGIRRGYVLQGLDGFALLLLSVFGPTLVGVLCAVIGIGRREHPKSLSIAGLLANAAFPTTAIIFVVGIKMGILKGGLWIDL